MEEERLHPAPTATTFDHALAIARVASIALPFMGPGIALLDALTAPSRGRRLEEWCEDVRLKINELSCRNPQITSETLSSNESFTSIIMQAASSVQKTHQTEKLEAFRNAVLNVAAGTAPDEHYQAFYLSLVDTLTPTHLRMLLTFRDQRDIGIREAPEWLKSNVAAQIAKDLLDRGLLGTGPGHPAVLNRERLIEGRDGVYSFQADLSLLGKEFLRFISEPSGVIG